MPELQGAISDGVKMRITILLLATLFLSCSQKIAQSSNSGQIQSNNSGQTQSKPKIIIPERKAPISLEKAVDWGAKQGGLEKLSGFSLPDGDFEIRFWISRRNGLSGLVFKKSGENWSAFNVDRMMLSSEQKTGKAFINPKSDWQNILQRLNEAEIFTLPDSSELKNYKGDKVEDGFSYVVEINKDGIYRIYEYSNPDWAENSEAKQLVKIGDIFADEFGLEEFRANPK